MRVHIRNHDAAIQEVEFPFDDAYPQPLHLLLSGYGAFYHGDYVEATMGDLSFSGVAGSNDWDKWLEHLVR